MKKHSECILDYSKLLGRIKTVFKTQEAFARAMDMSLVAVNQRLNNKTDWKPKEILKACDILNIGHDEIPDYFFCRKSK